MLTNVNTVCPLVILQEEMLLTIQLLTLSITYTHLILHMATYHTTFKVVYFDRTVFSVFLVIVVLMGRNM
jgi:hypothetical protein